jgi:hypothetical protein
MYLCVRFTDPLDIYVFTKNGDFSFARVYSDSGKISTFACDVTRRLNRFLALCIGRQSVKHQ